jgi:hypothetical protein
MVFPINDNVRICRSSRILKETTLKIPKTGIKTVLAEF